MRSIVLVLLFLSACGGSDSSSSTDMSNSADLAASSDLGRTGDMAMDACDVVQQTCGAAQKCILSVVSGNYVASCVAVGTKTAGQACTRAFFGSPDDDCVKGLECSLTGTEKGQPVCRKLCHAKSDCPASQTCTQLSDTNGMCAPPCEPFADTCSGGLVCSNIYADISSPSVPVLVAACGSPGPVPIGGDCGTDGCAAGGTCVSNAGANSGVSCFQFCDSGHPCPSGKTCPLVAGSDFSICE